MEEKIKNSNGIRLLPIASQQSGTQVIGKHDADENGQNRDIGIGFWQDLLWCFLAIASLLLKQVRHQDCSEKTSRDV